MLVVLGRHQLPSTCTFCFGMSTCPYACIQHIQTLALCCWYWLTFSVVLYSFCFVAPLTYSLVSHFCYYWASRNSLYGCFHFTTFLLCSFLLFDPVLKSFPVFQLFLLGYCFLLIRHVHQLVKDTVLSAESIVWLKLCQHPNFILYLNKRHRFKYSMI